LLLVHDFRGSNEIIGSDKCQLLSEWPVDKENGSATKGFKIARKWETFHLVFEMEGDEQHDVLDYLISII